MDGLDGLGGMHGVLVGGILFVLFAPVSPFLSILCLSISTASLGFLIWNIPPARIFMGDVGAHFLGLVFVWIALVGEGMGVPVGVTLLSLGAFIFDSSFTLCRRLLRGENLIKAHRFHLYQRLEQSGVSPLKVDGIYVVWTALFGLVAFAVQASSYQGLACATAIAFTLGMTVITEYRWMRVVKES